MSYTSSNSKAQGKKYISSFFLDRQNKRRKGDKIFKIIAIVAASYTLFLLALVIFSVGNGSLKIFSFEGFGFFSGTDWNSVEGRESYGALPYIIGTLTSSALAMLIGVPISLGIAIFISEISTAKIATPLSFIIELLAAVPS